MRHIIVCFIAALVLAGCSGGFKWNNPEVAVYWMKFRGEFFPDSLTSFFPINNLSIAKSFKTVSISSVEKKKAPYKNKNQYLTNSESLPFFPYIMTEVYFVENEDEWEIWDSILAKESVSSFLAGDTLAYFRITVEYYYLPYEKEIGYISEEKVALPQFPQLMSPEYHGAFSKETACSLPPEARVFVMKNGHSCITKVHRAPHPYAPDSMQHGYSSGIAQNYPCLYFWAVAW